MTTPYRLLCHCLAALLLLSGCASESENLPVPENQNGITITAKAIEMLPEVITSRASVEKTEAEKKINMLHLFFFDADGNFLTTKERSAFKAYQVVDLGNSANNSVIVPENVFPGHNTLDGVQIVAVANPECDTPGCDRTGCTFRVKGINPGGEICHGDKDDAAAEKAIGNLSDLLGWYYRPAKIEDVTKLPEAGMPMLGYLKVEGTATEITLSLRPLMARVDVNVKLDDKLDEKVVDHSLKITEYVIKNLPGSVPFDGGNESGNVGMEEAVVSVTGETLAKGEESGVFTYYTFENVRAAKAELPETVKNMTEEEQQRWKPTIADENASAFAMRGEYTDHQGIKYNAQYTVYLGSNPVDNFEVKRNHCYKNNITISGIDNISTNDGYITFDGRVNVETFNEMYLSIINEKFMDAHWGVIPMDIYFSEGADSPECTVTIPDDCKEWIHLEHCSSEGMTDDKFVAGWGCKHDYFTDDMLTNVVKETSAIVTHSRDRIYFYLDENASTKPRTAIVEIKYKSANEERTDHVEIVQTGLLPFTYKGTTYYMEAYEEYTMHYDPLDPHGTTGWYDLEGIPWAAEGSPLNGRRLSYSTYSWVPVGYPWHPISTTTIDGFTMSEYLLGKEYSDGGNVEGLGSLSEMTIYPVNCRYAVYWAVGKNKRKTNGEYAKLQWILPGISELETMLEFFKLPSFYTHYYWSSNTARNPSYTIIDGSPVREGNKHRENPYRARATKLDTNGSHIASEISVTEGAYPHAKEEECNVDQSYPAVDYELGAGGRTLRTQKLRVRAIRTADGVTTD